MRWPVQTAAESAGKEKAFTDLTNQFPLVLSISVDLAISILTRTAYLFSDSALTKRLGAWKKPRTGKSNSLALDLSSLRLSSRSPLILVNCLVNC